MSDRTPLLRGAEEVVDGLHFWSARRINPFLSELREPVAFHSSASCDLALTQFGLVDKFVCALQKIHRLILAKCYPLRKQNFTHPICQHIQLWPRVKITSPGECSLSSRGQTPS